MGISLVEGRSAPRTRPPRVVRNHEELALRRIAGTVVRRIVAVGREYRAGGPLRRSFVSAVRRPLRTRASAVHALAAGVGRGLPAVGPAGHDAAAGAPRLAVQLVLR